MIINFPGATSTDNLGPERRSSIAYKPTNLVSSWQSITVFGSKARVNVNLRDGVPLNEINPTGIRPTKFGMGTELAGSDPQIDLPIDTTPSSISVIIRGTFDVVASNTDTIFATSTGASNGYQLRVSAGQLQLLKQGVSVLSAPTHKTLVANQAYTFGLKISDAGIFELYLDGLLLSSGVPITGIMNLYLIGNKRFSTEDWDGVVLFAAATSTLVSQAEMIALTRNTNLFIEPVNAPFIALTAEVPEQFLLKTEDLAFTGQGAWVFRSGSSAVDSGDNTPAGSDFFTVTTVTSANSFVHQDHTEAAFDGARVNIQAVVKAEGGVFAAVGLWCVNIGGQVTLQIDTTDGSLVIEEGSGLVSEEADTSDSIFAVDLGGGVWRVSMTIDVPAGNTRIIPHLHRNQHNNGSANYGEVNVTLWDNDGIPTYVSKDTGVDLPVPTKFATRFAELNPTVDAEWDAYDVERSDFTFDTSTNISTEAELITAVSNAEAAPSDNHLILWTVNSIAEDIFITLTADFISNGGALVIDTTNGEMLENTEQLRITGGNGCSWFHYHGRKTFNQYAGQFNQENLHYHVFITNGNWCFGDFNAGNGDQVGNDIMQSAIGLYRTGTVAGTSTTVKRYKLMGCTSSFRNRGYGIIKHYDGYDGDELEDSFYINNNTTADLAEPCAIWRSDIVQGPPGSANNLGFICVNTRDEPWIDPGEFYEYEVGQSITQNNGGAGTFRATITVIYEGDGVSNSGYMTNARSIDNPALTGWKGDIVYYTMDDDSDTYQHANVAIVSPTASYVPTLLVASGAATLFDSGIFTGIVHTDGLQIGADNDDVDSEYLIGLHGVMAAMDSPAGGEVQYGIFNNGTTPTHRIYDENLYASTTAIRGNFLNNGDYVSRNSLYLRAALGSDYERDISDPNISYGGAQPQITVGDPSQAYDNKPILDGTFSGANIVTQGVIDDGMPFPYLGDIALVNSLALTGSAGSYDDLFNGTFARYSDNEVRMESNVIPYNVTRLQAKALIANYYAFYFEPLAGWDYTTTKSGSGYSFPNIIGNDWSASKVPGITFTNYWVQTVLQGGVVNVPGFTATDGVTNLTGSVIVTNTVDTNLLIPQYIQYDVTNADGNTYTTYSVVLITESVVAETSGIITNIVQEVIRAIIRPLIAVGFISPPPSIPWILAGGFWNDQGMWIDTELWED